MAGEGEPLVFPQPEGASGIIAEPLTLAPDYIKRFNRILSIVPEVDERFVAAAILTDKPQKYAYEDLELSELAINLAAAHTELSSAAGVPVIFVEDEDFLVGRTTEASGLYLVGGEEDDEDPFAYIPATGILEGDTGKEDAEPPAITVAAAIPDDVLIFPVSFGVVYSKNVEARTGFTSNNALILGESAVAGYFAGTLTKQDEIDLAVVQRMAETLSEHGFDVPKL